MNRLFVLAALALFGCSYANAQPRSAPRRAPHASDAGATAALSRANVIPVGPGVAVTSGWEPRCVASRGCAAPPAIPQCAPGLAARAIGDVLDNRLTLAGHPVAVRANLEAAGGCTEMACPAHSCCNHCSGSVSLGGATTGSIRQLALSPSGGPTSDPRFACTGDDSGLCCGTNARGQQVIAQGVLRPVPNGGGRYYLESPSLCTP